MLDHRTVPSSLPRAPQAANAATGTALPAAAQALLARLVRDTTGRLDPVLASTLDLLEKSLFTQADTGSGDLQQVAFDAMRQIRRYRADLLPAFLSVMQKQVDAAISEAATANDPPKAAPANAWALLDKAMAEDAALIDVLAARAEARLHLPLHLLGHRLGALLQRDAIETGRLPIGPRALLRALFDASACLDLAPATRHALLRQFDRCLAPVLADLYAGANACLADAGILPGLQGYQSVPRAPAGDTPANASTPSTRPCGASEGEVPGPSDGGRSAEHSPPKHAEAGATSRRVEPATMHWQPVSASDDELFGVMRELLGNRRALLGRFAAGGNTTQGRPLHPVSPVQVSEVLRRLQHGSPTDAQPAPAAGQATSGAGLKPLLLAQLQASAPPEHRAELPPAQGDVVDLLDMLFDHLLKDAPACGVAAPLLTRLQVPLLRVALEDAGFFTRNQHPARRLLDSLADAGLYWHDGTDADEDFGATLRGLVERVATDFDGDLAVFEVASEHLQQQLAARMRKAAIAERRHVQAERGRERLEQARMTAAEAMRATIGERRLSGVVHSLLTRAWTDVLALTALRGSDGEALFGRQVDVARWLVQHDGREPPASVQGCGAIEIGPLQQELCVGLSQIGYHLDDAEALARTVFGQAGTPRHTDGGACETREHSRQAQLQADASEVRAPGSTDDTTSTRIDDSLAPAAATVVEHILVMHQRLGVRREYTEASEPAPGPQTEAVGCELDASVRQRLDQLRRLPFGTWFDLADEHGRRQRYRMSWFSTITDRCLFVNHRGQRAGDHTLAWLAAEMEQGRARVVRDAQASVVDSAWQAILGVLRSFAPKSLDLATA